MTLISFNIIMLNPNSNLKPIKTPTIPNPIQLSLNTILKS